MSGRVIRVIQKKLFEFSSLKNLQSQNIVAAERIDVSQWTDATLMVRVHSAATIASSISVNAYADGFTEEDPTTVFQATTASATVTLSGNQTAGTFSLATLDDAPMGAMVRVIVTGTQASPAGTVKANLSVDLALKD